MILKIFYKYVLMAVSLIIFEAFHISSVPLLCLMAFFRNPTIKLSQNCCLLWLTGMLWRNYECIMISHLPSWTQLQSLWARSSVLSRKRLVQPLRLRSFAKNTILDFVAKPKRPQATPPIITWLMAPRRRGWRKPLRIRMLQHYLR